MNHPIPYILLAESDANIVAYILLIAGPLLAMVFFYFWQKTIRTRDLMTATERSPKGQLTEGPERIRVLLRGAANQSLASATVCTLLLSRRGTTQQNRQQG
tara:strand:+ start:270 stop:572 length:303 start_codon:yes stop_codon:yes gene_type:complete